MLRYATWEEDAHYEVFERLDERLDAWASLSTADAAEEVQRGAIEWLNDEPPSPETSDELFHPLREKSPFYKIAKNTLPQAHVLCGPLFDPRKVFSPAKGTRYTKLRAGVAWASHYLCGQTDVSPEHLYALFFRVVEQWGDDDDGTAWIDRLWIFVEYYWSLDFSRVQEEKADAAAVAQVSADTLSTMIEGAREWAHELRELQGLDAKRWISRHMLAYQGARKEFYILSTDGTYSATPVSSPQLVNALKNQGFSDFLKLRTETGWRSPQDLVNHCGTVIREIRFEAGRSKSRIINVDTDAATLGFGVYGLRQDLEPTYDGDCDEWLQVLAGNRYFELCEYIAHALAFAYGALPLLSITGDPDVGKKMLMMGLAECLDTNYLATADDLFGDWNDGLLRSPFVWTDEGMPSNTAGKHPADRMREVIGNGTVKVKRRFMATSELMTNLRIFLTANDHDLVMQLTQNRDLNDASRKAIAQRLIHIDVPKEAAAWLEQKGGMRFTGSPGRRWIHGDGPDDSQSSNYILAKHFLWLHSLLYKDGPPVQEKRFLMMGTLDQPIFSALRVQSQTSPFIISALLRMLNDIADLKHPKKKFDKLVIEDSPQGPQVWMLAGALIEYAKAKYEEFAQEKIPSAKAVAHAIDNIAMPTVLKDLDIGRFSTCHDGRIRLLSRNHLRFQWWKQIDVKALLRVAQAWQTPCPLLEQMVDGADVQPMVRDLGPPAIQAVA